MFLVAPDEWKKGLIRVKDLIAREEHDVPAADYMSLMNTPKKLQDCQLSSKVEPGREIEPACSPAD